MKIYAVREGRKTGLFYSWRETEEVTKGFPGAEYKSFHTIQDAVSYLHKGKVTIESREEEDTYYAYTDGSNVGNGSAYSGSVVVVYNGEIIHEDYVSGSNPEYTPLRNIAGELLGAFLALRWVEENQVSHVVICHDYEGVGKWGTGEYVARNPLAKQYKALVDHYTKQGCVIRFSWLRGHTGDKYNERADMLAKKALGIKK